MAINRDLTADDEVFYDTDKRLRYVIYEGNPTEAEILAGTATVQDVSGWTIGWTLRKKVNAADPPIIQKSTPSDGITISGVFNADPSLNTQVVEVLLEDTDTYNPDVSPEVNIKAGYYQYALKRIDEGRETILVFGKLKLLQAAAWE